MISQPVTKTVPGTGAKIRSSCPQNTPALAVDDPTVHDRVGHVGRREHSVLSEHSL
ncbi:hypothetical protein [Halocatena pleomorpha]|uniref:hypothetical protein n=1 Tax=Halocatena pleomorpha TaxID=1785090 RepID=UPI00163B0DB4|nr:hypothetical protein [Halocatena pleomorpha]